MAFNLLTEPWLEVRRKDGLRETISICDIVTNFDSNPIISLNFPRPDWSAAVTEFIIGVIYLAMAPKHEDEWAEIFENPPTKEEIEKKLEPFFQYFGFDEENFAFQDFETLGKAESKPLSGLLIEAPGAQTAKFNSDLFIKRNDDFKLCLKYAAAALITLQTYAPAGGQGHRTSMRGGGPLTTLIMPVRKEQNVPLLWDFIWANVPNKQDGEELDIKKALPWLAPTIVSPKAEAVIGEGNPLELAFFATPRRIRLQFADGICSLSGEDGKVAIGYKTQNFGANYLSWQHPLSPYRKDKKEGFLPLHPNAGQSDYGDWLAWWGGDGLAATVVELWEDRKKTVRKLLHRGEQIAAFGYDLDNAKARQWLDVEIPFFPIFYDKNYGSNFKEEIKLLIAASDEAAKATTRNAKIALYGIKDKSHYKLPDNLPMNALKEIGETLWRETEEDFKNILDELEKLVLAKEPRDELRKKWRKKLCEKSLKVFEDFLDVDGLCVENPRRVLWAKRQLLGEFANFKTAKITKALEIPVTKKENA